MTEKRIKRKGLKMKFGQLFSLLVGVFLLLVLSYFPSSVRAEAQHTFRYNEPRHEGDNTDIIV